VAAARATQHPATPPPALRLQNYMFLIRFFATSGGCKLRPVQKEKARCESLLDLAVIAIVILIKLTFGNQIFLINQKQVLITE
jgi:hypothetical protein